MSNDDQRRARVGRMTYDGASFRYLIRHPAIPTEDGLMLDLARHARDTAPDRTNRAAFVRYVDALSHGRRVGVVTGTMVLLHPVDPELVRQVDEVFQGDAS
jgi:hypothetical protein